ncbi:FAD-dependent oxidoreductase [Actinotalea sp.]|uniref:FAD-dependent oxidoreductase n=1 Tax=Actinotalea sp. TaxID=1872145 RepID=UPI00356B4747
MAARVVVVGGGYGGVAVARALDEVADVVLVEPKDAFVHATAALRAVVDPSWNDRVFYPYDGLLTRGRVVRDRARLVSPGLVRLSTNEAIEADHIVLATGTGYPFPAKYLESSAAAAKARLERLRADMAACERILVVGAGAVGLELAGEITSAFPHLEVVLVDRENQILPGDYLPELRTELLDQLGARKVTLVLGAELAYLPGPDVGVREPFTVRTTAGTEVAAQMWFRCYGSDAPTDHLDAVLRTGMHHDGTLPVTPHLQLVGQPTVWAVGDLTDVPEDKRATAARAHAAVVVANIRAVIEGGEPTTTYTAAPELFVVPLGPDGGASEVVDEDGRRRVLGASETSRIKGADLFAGSMASFFGLDES